MACGFGLACVFLPAQKRTEDKSHMFTLSPNTLALKLRQQISTHHRSDTYFRTQIIDKRLDRAIAHVVHHYSLLVRAGDFCLSSY